MSLTESRDIQPEVISKHRLLLAKHLELVTKCRRLKGVQNANVALLHEAAEVRTTLSGLFWEWKLWWTVKEHLSIFQCARDVTTRAVLHDLLLR